MKLPRRKFTAEEIAIVDSRIRAATHAKAQDFIFDPGRYVSLLTNRGAGKTFDMLCMLIRAMVRGDATTGRGANCLYVAKNREHARGIMWGDAKELIFRLGFEDLAKFDEVRSELTLCNGSWLKLLGFDERDEIEKPRGKSWHLVVVDEPGSARADLLTRFVEEVGGPRLVGAIVLGGTPGYLLEGSFYEATRPGSKLHRPYAQRNESWPHEEKWVWSSHSFSTQDGADAGIKPIAEIHARQLEDKRLRGYSDSNPKWLREGVGQWALDNTTSVYAYRAHDDAGAEFNQWTPTTKPTDSTRWARLPPGFDPKTWGYAIALDIGWRDAFALEAFAWSYADPRRTVWHIGESYKTKQRTKQVAVMLIGDALDSNKPGGIIGELGWPDFMVGDFSGQGDRFIEDMRVDYGIPIKAVDKHPKYKDPAVEIVNGEFFDGRIKILAGSELAKELVALQWVVDPDNGKRHENPKQPNHGCDALLYFRVSVTALLPAASAAAAAKAQPTAEPARASAPSPRVPAPAPKVDADGWSSDTEGWSSSDSMDGATEGSW